MIMLTVLQVIVTANDQNGMNAIYCMHLKDDKKSPNRNTETKEKEKTRGLWPLYAQTQPKNIHVNQYIFQI